MTKKHVKQKTFSYNYIVIKKHKKITKTHTKTGETNMAYVTTQDGVDIFYKDWGPKDAQVLFFHHGWPLSSDDWDTQLLFFLNEGFRVVAHDRRGHGRSSQVWDGHDMDHYADDVAEVVKHLGIKNAVHIGHSTGGGEVVDVVGGDVYRLPKYECI